MNIIIKHTRFASNLRFFYQHWLPKNPRALVVLVHGLGDHIGRYQTFISSLAQKNFACALYDQRGHGRSDGYRCHVATFNDWLDDLSNFVSFSKSQIALDTPLFIVGISLGALIGINFVVRNDTHVSGMVAVSAAISPTINIPKWKRKVATHLSNIYPRFTIDNGIKFMELTNSKSEIKSLTLDPYFRRKITVGAGVEIENTLRFVSETAKHIHIPILFLAGENDRVCDPYATRQFSEQVTSLDKRFNLYRNMQHDLLHDSGSHVVVSDIETWIEEHS